jgi:hypothetical protein
MVVMQWLPGENNSSNHFVQTGSELPQVPITTYPVDRKNEILLTIQLSDETTSEILCNMQPIRPRRAGGKIPSAVPPTQLSNKRGSTLPHTAQVPSGNTRIGHQRNKSITFAELTELFVVIVPGYFVLLLVILLLPLFYPYLYPLHFLMVELIVLPSPLLFSLPLLIHSLLILPPPSSSPTCHITPPSYTFTAH